MSEKAQQYANHRKFVPIYHFVAMPILLVNLGLEVGATVRAFSPRGLFDVAVAFALLVVALFARVFAAGAQDRVIRLEERMRMKQVLPEDMQDSVHDVYVATVSPLAETTAA